MRSQAFLGVAIGEDGVKPGEGGINWDSATQDKVLGSEGLGKTLIR